MKFATTNFQCYMHAIKFYVLNVCLTIIKCTKFHTKYHLMCCRTLLLFCPQKRFNKQRWQGLKLRNVSIITYNNNTNEVLPSFYIFSFYISTNLYLLYYYLLLLSWSCLYKIKVYINNTLLIMFKSFPKCVWG